MPCGAREIMIQSLNASEMTHLDEFCSLLRTGAVRPKGGDRDEKVRNYVHHPLQI